MFIQPRSLRKSVLAGLAVCAVAPAAAGAVPATEGQSVAAGGGPGVSASDFQSVDRTAPDNVDRVAQPISKAAPDQIDRVVTPKAQAGPPAWPSSPKAVVLPRGGQVRHTPAAATSNDNGLDTAEWIAIGGGALVLIAGLGLAGTARARRPHAA